jgi:hypothetical protein
MIESLPAVIEHRKTCRHCLTAQEPGGTALRWARLICDAEGRALDDEIVDQLTIDDRLLTRMMVSPLGPEVAKRVSIASMARFMARKSAAAGLHRKAPPAPLEPTPPPRRRRNGHQGSR